MTLAEFLDSLQTTWPARMVQGAVQGAMAPGNAFASSWGNPVTTEQMIAPAANLAGFMAGAPGGVGGLGSGFRLPVSPAEINDAAKVAIGTVYRGVEGGTNAQKALRVFKGGDLGDAVYVTPNEKLAASYGGGPKARVSDGTRVVHSYNLKDVYPEDVAYLFGGSKYGEDASLYSGNGIELWRGPWSGKAVENALKQHTDIKLVVGTPGSVGINQIAVRDPSILEILKKPAPTFGGPVLGGH